MDVILLDDVDKLGLRGEVVSVANGYARNFLLPRRLAERATPGKVAELRRRDEQKARQEARTAEQAEQVAEVLTKTVLRFEVSSGPTGTLFGSVTPTNVADEIWRTRRIRVDRRKIDLEPIKRIGRYEVPIDVFEGVRVQVKTLVVPEGGELPPEEELAAMVAAEEAAAVAEAPAQDAAASYVVEADDVDSADEADEAAETAGEDALVPAGELEDEQVEADGVQVVEPAPAEQDEQES